MNTQKYKIRAASKEDAAFLADIGAQTFSETYAYAHSKEDMSAYLKDVFNTRRISKDIEHANAVFLIYEIDNIAYGYAKLTSEKHPHQLKELKSVELRRIYVVKNMTGKKIGKVLMERCLRVVKDKGYEVIWLAVWEHNPRAISFYEKFGFEIFGTDTFKLGKTERNLLLMKKEI